MQNISRQVALPLAWGRSPQLPYYQHSKFLIPGGYDFGVIAQRLFLVLISCDRLIRSLSTQSLKTMKNKFLTSSLIVGILTLASLTQAIPAQAAPGGGNPGGGNPGGGNPGGGNPGGGNPGNGSIANLPVLSSFPCSTNNLSLAPGGSPANACFGQVADPANDVGNFPTLLDFLNSSEDKLDFGYVGEWLPAGDEIQNGSGIAANFLAGVFSSAATTGKSGDWLLSLNQPNLIEALVISVKGGDGWSAYLFDPANLASSFSGGWTTAGLQNNGGNQPDISHISAYYVARAGEEPETIPTPALIPGAIAMGAALLRKKKKEQGSQEG